MRAARALIISGAGRHFSAGIDMEALMHLANIAHGKSCPARAREKIHAFVQRAQAAFNVIEAPGAGPCRHPRRMHRRRGRHGRGLRYSRVQR